MRNAKCGISMHARAHYVSAMHLYVHVPFCRRRCSYCDFAIAVRKRIPADAFVDAVTRELAMQEGGAPLDTLYFGGGTPSLLPPAVLADLMEGVLARRPLAP